MAYGVTSQYFSPIGPNGQSRAGGALYGPNMSAIDQLTGQAIQAAGPTLAEYGNQIADLYQQLGLSGAMTNSEMGYQTAQSGYQLGQLGIQGEQLGLQGQDIAAQQQLLGGQEGLASKSYTQQLLELKQQQAATNRGIMGSAATSGVAGGGTGANYAQQQANQAYNNAVYNAQLSREGQLKQFAYQGGQLGRAKQSLSLAAQSNNLSESEVRSRLDYALQQLGLSGKMNTEQLLEQISNAKLGGDQTILSLLGPLYLATGLNLGSVRG